MKKTKQRGFRRPVPQAPTMKEASAKLDEVRAEVGRDVKVWTSFESDSTWWDDAPRIVCLILLVVAAVWISVLLRQRTDLIVGAPHSYRIETKGYGLAPWRTTTDGWTSNVGTKASAIRQAWEHWEQHQKSEWKEAK